MNFEFFIVKKSIRSLPGEKSGTNSLVGISVVAIALSMAVMILSVTILTGFKKEIKDKLTGFGGHIQISRLDANNSWEAGPISSDQPFLEHIRNLPGVNGLYPFITKPAIVQAGNELQGIVLKGVDSSFNWNFFSDNLVSGSLPSLSDSAIPQVLISESLSRLLRLKSGQKLTVYFIQDPPRMPRPFRVAGIYKTGLEEYDRLFVFCPINSVREVCGWNSVQVSGVGINLDNTDKMEEVAEKIKILTGEAVLNSGELLEVKTLHETASGIFDFLSLTDTNVWVILALMILIAGFNMISGLLIIILDRTRMIGILKALGASNRSVSRIFLYQGLYIISKGLVLGNLIGLTLAILQDRFQFIPLNPENYFVDSVPILINPFHLLLINLLTLALTLLMMLVPAGILTRISPDKTIKFD